jgi:hypothetical protein
MEETPSGYGMRLQAYLVSSRSSQACGLGFGLSIFYLKINFVKKESSDLDGFFVIWGKARMIYITRKI